MAREKILLIEDDQDILELVKYNLEKEGYSVISYTTGEDALAFMESNSADIILLDNMKRYDLKKGLEIIRNENKKRGSKILSEASGGITLANIRAIARMHVDRISIGAVTHSAKAIDFSLELE